MQHPVSASLYDSSDPFGSMAGRSYGHTGSDYVTAYGEVYSVDDAVVIATGWNSGNGNYVSCYLPNRDWDGFPGGIYIAYIHLSSINVSVGQTLKQGQRLGVAGNTGSNSRGPHLHITMGCNTDVPHLGLGNPLFDPFAYIQARLGAPKPPVPVPSPKPEPPAPPVGPPTPQKLSKAEQKAAIEKLKQYVKIAKQKLARERARGVRADVRKIAQYREQIARNETRIKNIRRDGY